jgi:hypothetical protein
MMMPYFAAWANMPIIMRMHPVISNGMMKIPLYP